MSTPDKESFILTFEFSEYEDVHFCKLYHTKGVMMECYLKSHGSSKRRAMLNVLEDLAVQVNKGNLIDFGIAEND